MNLKSTYLKMIIHWNGPLIVPNSKKSAAKGDAKEYISYTFSHLDHCLSVSAKTKYYTENDKSFFYFAELLGDDKELIGKASSVYIEHSSKAKVVVLMEFAPMVIIGDETFSNLVTTPKHQFNSVELQPLDDCKIEAEFLDEATHYQLLDEMRDSWKKDELYFLIQII